MEDGSPTTQFLTKAKIAKRNDERGRRIYKAGIIYGFFFLLISVVGIALVLTETITTNEFLWICLFAIAFAILSLYTLIISTSFHKEIAWVECKNLKGKATYEQVQKCLQEFNDYKLSGDKEYKYVVLYFVSASGFVENALKLAMDNDIICYELKNENFEKVTYWK